MAGRIFFDANVILDFSVRSNKNPKAFEKLFSLIENGSIQAIATMSIIQTCTFYMLQYVGFERTKKLLYLLVPQFSIIEGQKKHIIEALNSDQKDIEDAIHYYIALEHGLDAIVTSDKDFIKLSTPLLPIFSPEGLLDAFGFEKEF